MSSRQEASSLAQCPSSKAGLTSQGYTDSSNTFPCLRRTIHVSWGGDRRLIRGRWIKVATYRGRSLQQTGRGVGVGIGMCNIIAS